ELLFDVNDAVAAVGGGAADALGIDLVARCADHVTIAQSDDVRRFLDLIAVEQRRAAHEAGNHVIRNRSDRLAERLAAHLRRQALAAAALGRTATVADGDARLAVDVDELEHVARIDQVRVLDLGIDVPDFGPIPGIAQEYFGDVPQRVAGFHRVLVGGIRRQRDVAAGGDGALTVLCGG